MINSQQCSGTSAKGLRCKKRTKAEKGFCNYHVNQASSKISSNRAEKETGPLSPRRSVVEVSTVITGQKDAGKLSTKVRDSGKGETKIYNLKTIKKPGYIYIYTLSHLLDATLDTDWLHFKSIPHPSGREKTNFVKDLKWREFKSADNVLMKIGMTTQTVKQRVKQWEYQCHRPLTLLNPHTSSNQQASRLKLRGQLTDLFDRLNIKDKTSAGRRIENRYVTFRESDNGFFCSSSVNLAESEIHSSMREKYGVGKVFCMGCMDKSAKVGETDVGQMNIHTEWFVVPKKEVSNVFKLIDEACKKYNE